MTHPTSKRPGGRPPGFWRTTTGRAFLRTFFPNDPDTSSAHLEELWVKAVRLVRQAHPTAAACARAAGVSRRTWRRWAQRVGVDEGGNDAARAA